MWLHVVGVDRSNQSQLQSPFALPIINKYPLRAAKQARIACPILCIFCPTIIRYLSITAFFGNEHSSLQTFPVMIFITYNMVAHSLVPLRSFSFTNLWHYEHYTVRCFGIRTSHTNVIRTSIILTIFCPNTEPDDLSFECKFFPGIPGA